MSDKDKALRKLRVTKKKSAKDFDWDKYLDQQAKKDGVSRRKA